MAVIFVSILGSTTTCGYGYPVDFNRLSKLVSFEVNHTSATEYAEHIDQYISEELQYGALYGPFQEIPNPIHISPLMTRAKQNSDKRHTTVDLSWPNNASVNSAVNKTIYLRSHFILKYPSLVDKIKNIRPRGSNI